MRPRAYCSALMLAACVVVQACAREHVVHTPTLIRILTQQQASTHGTSASDAAPLVTDARILEPVVRVTARLIAAARRSEYGPRTRASCWVIAVYQNTRPRSFVGPDGSIVVYTGTFRLAETEAGLAALLSHELVHALTHEQIPMSPVCAGSTDRPEALFTRDEEFKTDEFGLTLMADAGYDPRELLGLWERMRREQDGSQDGVLLYLTYDRRMEQIAQWLPLALMRYERANRAPQKVLPMD
jgi:metalloendopeptidase OMA1, mitochondrial